MHFRKIMASIGFILTGITFATLISPLGDRHFPLVGWHGLAFFFESLTFFAMILWCLILTVENVFKNVDVDGKGGYHFLSILDFFGVYLCWTLFKKFAFMESDAAVYLYMDIYQKALVAMIMGNTFIDWIFVTIRKKTVPAPA